MKRYENGKFVEMTAEEIEKYNADRESASEEQPPTIEERLFALESAMLEQLLGGASNV